MADVEMVPLCPDVPLEDAASLHIRRVMDDGEGHEHLASIPYAWPPETTEIDVGEACGGGLFQVQARGHDGRFVKGARSHRFLIDAAPREFEPPGRLAAARGNAPGAPTAPGAPVAGTPVGDALQVEQRAMAVRGPAKLSPSGVAVPFAQPLVSQPTAMIDLPELPPEVRHFTQVLLTLNAQHFAAVREAANVERDSARGATSVALAFAKGDQAAIEVYRDTLARERDRVTAAERELSELRAKVRDLELAAERAKARGGEAARPESLLDVLQAIMLEAIEKLGVPVIAGALGMSPKELEAFSASRVNA